MIGCGGEKEQATSVKEDIGISARVKDGAAMATGLARVEPFSGPRRLRTHALVSSSGADAASSPGSGLRGGGILVGEEGERYLVGSSKNMTGGLLTSSRAMARRFLCPPESRAVLVWEQDIRPSAVRISVTWPGRPPTPCQLQSLCFPQHHPNLSKHLPEA